MVEMYAGARWFRHPLTGSRHQEYPGGCPSLTPFRIGAKCHLGLGAVCIADSGIARVSEKGLFLWELSLLYALIGCCCSAPQPSWWVGSVPPAADGSRAPWRGLCPGFSWAVLLQDGVVTTHERDRVAVSVGDLPQPSLTTEDGGYPHG